MVLVPGNSWSEKESRMAPSHQFVPGFSFAKESEEFGASDPVLWDRGQARLELKARSSKDRCSEFEGKEVDHATNIL